MGNDTDRDTDRARETQTAHNPIRWLQMVGDTHPVALQKSSFATTVVILWLSYRFETQLVLMSRLAVLLPFVV